MTGWGPVASRDPVGGDAPPGAQAPDRWWSGDVGLYTQALPILALTAVGGAVAGSVLAGMEQVLRAIPALIVVAPALISLRGTINGSIGARLGSAAHMGLLTGRGRRAEIVENVLAGLTLSASMSTVAALLGYATTWLVGRDPGDPVGLVLVSVAAALTSGLLLSGVTVATVVVAHRRGLDPDNVTSPILATVGDIVTLAFLFLYATWWTGVGA